MKNGENRFRLLSKLLKDKKAKTTRKELAKITSRNQKYEEEAGKRRRIQDERERERKRERESFNTHRSCFG